MKRFLKIHHFLFTLTFLLLEACGPGNAAQTSQVPSIQSTTPTTTPIRTPTQPLSPTSTSIPQTATQDTSIEPIAQGAEIRIDSWAPDGLWLGFWLWTPEDMAADPQAPPGKLIFLNPRTDETCEYGHFEFSEHSPDISWQPDGRAAVSATDSYWIGFPCQDFVPTQAEEIEILGPPDETQSPDGTFRVETIIQDPVDGWVKHTTTITNSATGRVENRVDWELDERLGCCGLGGEWVTDDLFLIYETRSQGPLLIQAGGEVVRVAPDLFGVPATEIPQDSWDWVNQQAIAASVDHDDLYHILLHATGDEASFPPVLLFHSVTGEVETLPYTHLWHPGFTPDGRWVLLQRPNTFGGDIALWIRPVDPPGSPVRLIAEGTIYSALSPSQSAIAFGHAGEFTVLRFPDGESVNTWTTGEYSNHRLIWSPTGDFLATSGNIPEAYDAALFVVEVWE
ncbi:MAG: hypothetical protein GTO12_01595 [Proteobacteria bacterium]|nr:hypothetical protein [Pseudomonadota bacterium]